MKTFLAAIALALCIHLPINGQRPDDVYSIGKTNFAFYQAKNQTEVMSHGLTIFDNSSRDFPYISGAQRLELFLIHKFAGRTLTQTPPSIQLVFESRSKPSRYTNPGTRTLELTVDGRTIVQAGLALDQSTPIGLVTWENLSYDLSLTKANELLTARNSATLTLGNITHDLTASEIAVFKDFIEALRVGNSTDWRSPQKACTLFADVGITTHPYRYVGMNTFGCYASAVPLPAGSGNSVIFRPEGNQQGITDLILVLRVTSDKQTALASHEAFAILCGALASRSLGIELPNMLLLAAIVGNPYKWSIGSNTVEVSPTLRGSDGSYEVRFTIK